jgi:uncharacterized protein (UPF0261 family)
MQVIMTRQKSVVVAATLDTKETEALFVRDCITAWGINTILVDVGILGYPTITPDISRAKVAQAAGSSIEALAKQGDKGTAIATQAKGLGHIVQQLHAEGRLDGMIGLGGGQGSSICTAAMRQLPLGIPKLMLSTVASGLFQFGPYVGSKDICMMFSVTDIAGLNVISRPILANAANAIAGMVMGQQPPASATKPAMAMTMLGITTPGAMAVKAHLETAGFEVVVFHAAGPGGAAMENLIEAGKFSAVMDFSLHELINHLCGGLVGVPNRLRALTRTQIPAVISVGGADILAFESIEKAPEKYQTRPYIVHNAQITHILAAPDEMRAAAQLMVTQLNQALGPVIVTIPLKGYSEFNRAGSALWGPESNKALQDTLQAGLRPEIPLVTVDAHINDSLFAEVTAECMDRLIRGEAPQIIAARFEQS